jgi:hypothetical protein
MFLMALDWIDGNILNAKTHIRTETLGTGDQDYLHGRVRRRQLPMYRAKQNVFVNQQ